MLPRPASTHAGVTWKSFAAAARVGANSSRSGGIDGGGAFGGLTGRSSSSMSSNGNALPWRSGESVSGVLRRTPWGALCSSPLGDQLAWTPMTSAPMIGCMNSAIPSRSKPFLDGGELVCSGTACGRGNFDTPWRPTPSSAWNRRWRISGAPAACSRRAKHSREVLPGACLGCVCLSLTQPLFVNARLRRAGQRRRPAAAIQASAWA